MYTELLERREQIIAELGDNYDAQLLADLEHIEALICEYDSNAALEYDYGI